jgi:N-acetylglucosaminyl-diphospho-decaprenol L-rhamnosyltransferase
VPRIVAAVVSYNTRDLLARCLASFDEHVEVWVVDNASQDGSAQLVRERFGHVRLEARSDNLGFGPAVNLVAARTGDWDWLAVANADVALEPGALDALLAAGAADPRAGALAPRLILPDGSTQHSVYPFWSPAFALSFNLGRQRLSRRWGDEQCLHGFWDADRPRRVPWAVGAFLLVRRAAWDAAEGFDPGQWLYAEDVDLGWRLQQKGWATRYVPGARVLHEESAAAAQAWGSARTERWMAASYDWMFRRRGGLRTRVVGAANVLGAAARWAVARGEARIAYRNWARLHALGLRRRATVRARLPRPPSPRSQTD